MIFRKAFKFRLNTTEEIENKLFQFSGCSRFVWNKALAANLYRLENNLPIIRYNENSFWLGIWKKSEDYGFLKACHSQVLQASIKNLDAAFKDCFDKKQPMKRLPKFKRKGEKDSIRFPQGFKVDQGKSIIFLPKIGIVKYRNSRKIIGKQKNVTVSRSGKHWYIAIQTEYEIDEPIHPSTSSVGIDMGIVKFATLSNGKIYQPLNSFKKLSVKLAKLQKQFKNKIKFSNNWKKLKEKINKIHQRIANARRDYLHKISTEISEKQALVVVEDLKVANMSKRSKSKQDSDGKYLKNKQAQKSGLNKAILDQGWSMFVDMLIYKQAVLGGELLKVLPHYTSQTCLSCRHVARENRKTQSDFVCVECGFTENADIVGAKNILMAGHAKIACVVSGAVMPPSARTPI